MAEAAERTMEAAAPAMLKMLNRILPWLERSELPYVQHDLREEVLRTIAFAYGNNHLEVASWNYPDDDDEYEDRIVTDVEYGKDGKVDCISSQDGTIGWRDDAPIIPKPGDLARYYGRGFGYIVRGLFVNGVRVWYETVDECAARMEREAAAREQKRRDEFEQTGKAQLDAQYATLPLVFQKRIDRFRANNPDFRWEFEGYEMFCCTEAVKIANALEEPEAVEAFHALPYEQQQKRVPDLSDGHSGNTFGTACKLAYWYLKEPEAVITDHGALTVLVGGEEYGDVKAASGVERPDADTREAK